MNEIRVVAMIWNGDTAMLRNVRRQQDFEDARIKMYHICIEGAQWSRLS